MRRARLLLLPLLLNAAMAPAQDGPALALRLVEAGAPGLALRQARSALALPDAAPAWRNVAWAAAGGTGERLDPALPPTPEAPPSAWRAYRLAAADAALVQGDARAAREHLARLLWRDAPPPEVARRARRLIAESWLQPGQDAESPVNPVWLRLVRDDPSARDQVGAAALALVRSGQAGTALRLLEGVGLEGPVHLLARHRLGVVDPEQAQTGLRQMTSGPEGDLAWRALAALAADRSDPALRAEALERLLAAPQPDIAPAALWEAYAALAERVANARQMLAGADAAWLEEARAVRAESPLEGRALLAWLVREGRDAQIRAQAIAGLVEDLEAAGLAADGPRLLGGLPLPWPALDSGLRYHLGEIARGQRDYALAALLWEGVEAPPQGVEPRPWRLRRAEVWLRAGRPDAAAEALAGLSDDAQALPPEQARQALEVLEALRVAGRADAVDALARRLLPLVGPMEQRRLWLIRGAVAEGRGEAEAAAGHFLLAAGGPAPEAADALALEARQRAARQLLAAGLEEDARRQSEWLQRAQRHAAQRDPAPR